MIYTDPRLSPVLDTNGIVGAGSTEPGGEFPDSIGPGLYKFTLPDGQQVIVDQYGNIIGGAKPPAG